MLLSELLSRAGVTPDRVFGDAEISGMIMDSRKAKPGSLFTAMPSKNSDSHSFIQAAKDGGATAVLAHSEEGFDAAIKAGLAAILILSSADLQVRALEKSAADSELAGGDGLRQGADLEIRATTELFLPEAEYRFNEAVWRLAKVAFGDPSKALKLFGVTGTNGKTTTAWLIRDMLCAQGMKAGYLGTLGFQIPGEERELQNTTPYSIELNELLAEARDKGVEALAIEVSSHALAERRVDGIEFDVAVFTNLTQDHLDFHGSMETYEAAKLRLFTDLQDQSTKNWMAAINYEDPAGQRIRDILDSPPYEKKHAYVMGFGRSKYPLHPDVVGTVKSVQVDHIDLDLYAIYGTQDQGEDHVARIPLGGDYNVSNALCAATALYAFNGKMFAATRALEKVRPVPGRFEAVPNDAGIGILVDYAHSPDAIEKLLDAVRPLTKGRVITVFGCGGDRDRNKRPKMAKAASERSDITVVTSDNPRTEDPQAILNEVLTGIVPGSQSVDIIDRREAIAYAVQVAEPGDVVVIAGKGHENYQIIGRTKYPMDDREMAREGLALRSPRPYGGEG